MKFQKQQGAASIAFEKPVFIESAASIVGKKEGEGPIGAFFDMVCKDSLFG